MTPRTSVGHSLHYYLNIVSYYLNIVSVYDFERCVYRLERPNPPGA
jgi:hypothetical protein